MGTISRDVKRVVANQKSVHFLAFPKMVVSANPARELSERVCLLQNLIFLLVRKSL